VAAAIVAAGKGATLVGRLAQMEPAAIASVSEALCYADLASDTAAALRVQLRRAAADMDAAPSTSDSRAVAIEVLSFHRAASVAELLSTSRGASVSMLVVTLRAIGRLGGETGLFETAIRHEASSVRDAALAAMVRRGSPTARQRCREAVADPKLLTPTACALLGSIGEVSDVSLLHEACGWEASGESAVAALGTLGYFACVDPLLDLMSDARLACSAGAAFTRITGLVVASQPEDASATTVEDATFHELRPRPDPHAMRALWAEHAARFDDQSRWRSGKRLDAKAWRGDANHGDLLTRREELLRVWFAEPALHEALELDAPVRRQLSSFIGGER
jgi:hypothetical protein